MKQLILNYIDETDYKAIENAFEIIKRNGSKLKSKEDMCKLLIEKEVGVANILYHLSKPSNSKEARERKWKNVDIRD